MLHSLTNRASRRPGVPLLALYPEKNFSENVNRDPAPGVSFLLWLPIPIRRLASRLRCKLAWRRFGGDAEEKSETTGFV